MFQMLVATQTGRLITTNDSCSSILLTITFKGSPQKIYRVDANNT